MLLEPPSLTGTAGGTNPALLGSHLHSTGDTKQPLGWCWPPAPEQLMTHSLLPASIPCPKDLAASYKLRSISLILECFQEGETEAQTQKCMHSLKTCTLSLAP